MRLCRFNDDRLGAVTGTGIHDVTEIIKKLPPQKWPAQFGDALISNLDLLRPDIEALVDGGDAIDPETVTLRSPVANPSKIIAAPVNYKKHQDEANRDKEINFGRDVKTIDHYGLFLKANSSLVGPGEGIALRFPDRRNDHEVELAVIIGKPGNEISRDDALSHVAGYAIGLDISVRGTEDRSLRKSIDSYSVLGPWITTADEVKDPGNLDFSLTVNGEIRQQSNTSELIFDVPRLIEYASTFYTLHPGDIIMTGTPEGVGPLQPGDILAARIESVGAMNVEIRATEGA
jgi:2-keto-4-pentenoate hydratase/2-oxohepta-3-ene-1,7-dioic acid hydratase in catechol pathway